MRAGRERTVAGRESGAARGRRSASRRRRRRQAAPSESYPGRSSGASVSQPTLRDAVIISIVCLPFSLGGRKGEVSHRTLALPRSLFRISLFLALTSPLPLLRFAARYAGAASARLFLAPTDTDPLTHRATAEAFPSCCRAPRSSR